jgi:YggT family protein
MNLLITTLSTFIDFYSYLLIIRVLLTWFSNIDWSRQPFAALSQISDPYLNLFRSIIPAFGGIDFSPILAFLVLNLAGQFLLTLSTLPFVHRF